MKTLFKLILISLVICFNSTIIAQDLTERNKQLIEIADNIKEYYIFGDVANQLSDKLKSEIELKTFDQLTDKEFAKSLSSYLTKMETICISMSCIVQVKKQKKKKSMKKNY